MNAGNTVREIDPPLELRIGSGEQVVQPVEGGGPEDDGCHAFAVSFCAFGFGKQAEFDA
jgi:hypothetical protein